MTYQHYNVDSTELARKLIKVCSTTCLIAILQAVEIKHEEITDEDKQQLENLLDKVA